MHARLCRWGKTRESFRASEILEIRLFSGRSLRLVVGFEAILNEDVGRFQKLGRTKQVGTAEILSRFPFARFVPLETSRELHGEIRRPVSVGNSNTAT